MAMKKLDFTTLGQIDGEKIAATLNQLIELASRDCKNRSNVKKPRRVVMTLSFTPLPDAAGNCDHVKTKASFKPAFPPQETLEYSLNLKANGSLVFSEESPQNFMQTTFDDSEE